MLNWLLLTLSVPPAFVTDAAEVLPIELNFGGIRTSLLKCGEGWSDIFPGKFADTDD